MSAETPVKESDYPYIARASFGRRKGERCKIITPRSSRYSAQVQVEFKDGEKILMDRHQLRRSKEADNGEKTR